MKKILTLLFVLALILILSACGAKKEAGSEQGTAYNGSVDDLIKAGKNVKCVLQATENADLISGTIYVSGSKARSDFEQKGLGDKNYTGHFISDGTWMYTWNEAYKDQAVKFKIEDLQKEQFKSQADKQGAGDYENKMDYKCYAWQADQSMFIPPTDIKFMDFSSLMQQLQQQTQGLNQNLPGMNNVGQQSLCGQCDQAPNEQAKTQCKQSLGCQ
jgi:hypothetical protein